MISTILTFLQMYGGFFIAGILGLAVKKLQNIKRVRRTSFLQAIPVSVFIAYVVGLTIKNYTPASLEIIFIASVAGSYFSYDVIRELRQILQSTSSIVASKFGVQSKDESKKEAVVVDDNVQLEMQPEESPKILPEESQDA